MFKNWSDKKIEKEGERIKGYPQFFRLLFRLKFNS